MNNYASPYNPNYGAPAAAYPQQAQYDAAALDAYAQAQQHAAALQQLQQMYGGAPQYAMTYTGQSMPGAMAPDGTMIVAAPANLTPLQGAWWQQNTYGVPRWGLAAGALALTGIGLAWQAGMFGKGSSRSSSRSTTRRTSRDASRGARTTISRTGPRGRTTTLSTTRAMDSDSARDMNGRGRRRKTTKRRSSSSRSRRR